MAHNDELNAHMFGDRNDNLDAREYGSSNVVRTNGPEETKRYLQRAGITVCDENTPIERRRLPDCPTTLEQRIYIRCFRPPPPPPGKIYVKDEYVLSPPPPPLVICEKSTSSSSEPIFYRETPPTRPAPPPDETRIRRIPLPQPPPSVIIKRCPGLTNPPDVYVERWCPYPSPPPPVEVPVPSPRPQLPKPTCKIIEYECDPSRIVRKIEREPITEADPDEYIARYGPSLLDSGSLADTVRRRGITEDINCLCSSSSVSPSRADPLTFGCCDDFSLQTEAWRVQANNN